MTEEIYKILEGSGWTRKMEDGTWTGCHIKTIQAPSGTMIINGRPMQAPPEITRLEIEYKGDGWIENADGSGHEDTTHWDVRLQKGNFSQETTIVVYSPDQFLEMIKELGL